MLINCQLLVCVRFWRVCRFYRHNLVWPRMASLKNFWTNFNDVFKTMNLWLSSFNGHCRFIWLFVLPNYFMFEGIPMCPFNKTQIFSEGHKKTFFFISEFFRRGMIDDPSLFVTMKKGPLPLETMKTVELFDLKIG